MIIIKGIGWITDKKYGCVKQGLCREYNEVKTLYAQLKNESVFSYPVKGFSKFDTVSKMTCCAGALALCDAEIPYSEHRKQDIGILGTNTSGCLQSNVRYFKDYVENGRILARGNLFIYTLPSSPLAETAIHFGLQGPLLYMSFVQHRIASLLRHAGNMILRQETPAMLAIEANESESVCFVLSDENDASSKDLWNLDDLIKKRDFTFNVNDIVSEYIKVVS